MPHRVDSENRPCVADLPGIRMLRNDALDAVSGGNEGVTFNISEHGTYGGADGWVDSFSDPWGDGGFMDPGLAFDPGPGIDAGLGGDPWAGPDPAWAVGGDAPHDYSDPTLAQDGAVLGDPALGGGDPAWALPGGPSLTSDLSGPAPGTPTPIAGPTAEGAPAGGAPPGSAPGELNPDYPGITRDPYQPFMDILACGVIGAAAGQVGGALGAVLGAPLGPFAPFLAGALAFEARVLASEICLDAGRNGSTDTGGGNISDIVAP